jgi:hypothetical protein
VRNGAVPVLSRNLASRGNRHVRTGHLVAAGSSS